MALTRYFIERVEALVKKRAPDLTRSARTIVANARVRLLVSREGASSPSPYWP